MQSIDSADEKNKIRDFVIQNFLFGDGGSLKDDTSFMGEGIIDSTGILELVMHLEETYGIQVQPDEMVPENLDSVSRVADFIARRMAAKAASKA